jgi:antirestriction protein
MTSTTESRIYVACLASYNAGILHGAWIALNGKDTDEVGEEIAAMLKASPTAGAEEYAVHDFEGFNGYNPGEYPDMGKLIGLVEAADKAQDADAFWGWVAHDSYNADSPERFEDAYRGEWSDLGEYAADYWEQTGDKLEAPKGQWWHPLNYIDWDRMGADLETSGDVFTVDAPGGKVWVFDTRA